MGDLTPEELLAETCKVNEYYVERVDRHEFRKGKLWFRVKWLGYPEAEVDDPDAWVAYSDCKWSPVIRQCMREHGLRVQ